MLMRVQYVLPATAVSSTPTTATVVQRHERCTLVKRNRKYATTASSARKPPREPLQRRPVASTALAAQAATRSHRRPFMTK